MDLKISAYPKKWVNIMSEMPQTTIPAKKKSKRDNFGGSLWKLGI